jgi:hypothetical protein
MEWRSEFAVISTHCADSLPNVKSLSNLSGPY